MAVVLIIGIRWANLEGVIAALGLKYQKLGYKLSLSLLSSSEMAAESPFAMILGWTVALWHPLFRVLLELHQILKAQFFIIGAMLFIDCQYLLEDF